jgi:sulfur carrier protein ThiS adenylyltransferase
VEALAENLRRIRPELLIETVTERIDSTNCQALFADCDLVVEGFDQKTDKKMLVETVASSQIVVSASGIAGFELDAIRVRQLGNCFIVGDFSTDCADATLFAHKVTTVANYMARLILHIGS